MISKDEGAEVLPSRQNCRQETIVLLLLTAFTEMFQDKS